MNFYVIKDIPWKFYFCSRQFSEFVMQNTRLDSQCFPADTHRPGEHFPFTQHLPRSSSSSPLSCLHECLPELFFHVTVACFINSLPLPRCWWIISPKNTLQRLRGEDGTRKSGPVVIYRESARPILTFHQPRLWLHRRRRFSQLFLDKWSVPYVIERRSIASMGRVGLIMCSLQSHSDWFSFLCRRHQSRAPSSKPRRTLIDGTDSKIWCFGARQTKLNFDSIGSLHIQSDRLLSAWQWSGKCCKQEFRH